MKIDKIRLTEENIKIIKEIDDTFYHDEATTIEWYLERYTSKHNGYLIKNNDKVVGYLVAVPIKKEAYDAITNGVIVNDIYLNPKMYIEKSKYHYIVSFVLLENYRNQGIGTNLILSIIKNVDKGRYCALTISKEGAAVSQKFMKLKKQINDDVAVFEIKL